MKVLRNWSMQNVRCRTQDAEFRSIGSHHRMQRKMQEAEDICQSDVVVDRCLRIKGDTAGTLMESPVDNMQIKEYFCVRKSKRT